MDLQEPAGLPTASAPAVPDGMASVQRRTVAVLVTSQVLGGVGAVSGLAVGGLLAEELSGSTSLAGLAQTASVLGAALLAVPLARLAGAHGRRPALATGYALGCAGALTVVLAAALGWFWLLLVGTLLFGGGTAAGLQARYAATDSASAAGRGRALSVVVWATTVGAVAGPNLAGPGGRLGDSVGLPTLAGPFLFSLLAFLAAALVVALALAVPPRRSTSASGRGPGAMAALRVAAGIPRALLGLTAVATAHAVMVAVMVMTPVHLTHGGASLRVVGIVISAHVAGMYAASPLMGWLADRAGRVPGVLVGVSLLAASLLVGGTAGGDDARVGIALALLGLGWSASLVAGSTLLSESVPDEARTSVQGVSDLVMGVAAASAGAVSGVVLAASGYAGLNAAAALLLVPVLVLAMRHRPRGAGVAGARGQVLASAGRRSGFGR